jgi:organic radical activating enzyme
MLLVNEIFYSIQGEGPNAGKPAVFLRLAGCNLRCSWCDTKQAWNDKQQKTNDEIIKKIKKYPSEHLVVTGGEPLLQQDGLIPLLQKLKGYYVEVETNGSIPLKIGRYVEQINCSPKLKSSGNSPYPLKIKPKNRKVIYKFVVQNKGDIKDVRQYIVDNKISRQTVYLMPEGVNKKIVQERSKWLVEICKKEGYNFSPRLHIMLNVQ